MEHIMTKIEINENGERVICSDIITEEDTATILGITKKAVQHKRAQKLIPAFKVGRRYYFRASDIDNYVFGSQPNTGVVY